MVSDTRSTRTVESPTDSPGFGTGLNALLGGLAGILLSFIPLSPLLGGAISGYLEDGTPNDGLKVGALAGLIMLVPFVFMGFFVFVLLTGFAAGEGILAFGFMAVVMIVIGALYTVGLSMVGGFLGVYLQDEL